jgi:hypothetical protein
MKCFDCSGLGRDVYAVAVCIGCGAALCLDHQHVTPYWLTRTAVINRTLMVEPPTRAIRCGLCQQAHDAATGHHLTEAHQ